MPAMVMPFEAETRGLQPGMRVEFEIERGHSRARKIRVIREELEEVPKPLPVLQTGDELPDVKLLDHHGRPLEFAGRITAVNFIYTRCPLPNVCPRQAAIFAALARKYAGRAEFVSVTLDPEHDTVKKLAEYASRWNAGGWRLATGSPSEVRRLATALGVLYWPEEGVLAHSSATAIIDRKGRLAALAEGSSHRPDQIASLIEEQLEASR
jgi:protein SCO1/2